MAENETGASRLPRILLAGAALVAVLAVGYRAVKDKESPSAPVATAPAAGPDLATAISELESRLQKEPNDARGWRMLGMAFSQDGKFAEAARALSRSTQIDGKNAGGWAELGAALYQGGNGSMAADARAAFNKAIALDPREPLARYYRGIDKDLSGKHQEAIDDWLDMLESAPADAPWRDDYRQIVENVATKNKIDVSARLKKIPGAAPGRGEALATQGIPGPSQAEMKQAAQIPKGQQDAMIQGMVDGLATKLKANPKNLEGWIMLMRSRITLGETAKASQALKEARAAFAGDAAGLAQINEAAGALGIVG